MIFISFYTGGKGSSYLRGQSLPLMILESYDKSQLTVQWGYGHAMVALAENILLRRLYLKECTAGR